MLALGATEVEVVLTRAELPHELSRMKKISGDAIAAKLLVLGRVGDAQFGSDFIAVGLDVRSSSESSRRFQKKYPSTSTSMLSVPLLLDAELALGWAGSNA
jgi:hypothetical protein